MIPMNNWAMQAIEKLQKEKKSVIGRHETIMAPAVSDKLEDFCKQDAEFAQAVVQGGTFAECMRKVASGVSSHISDLDAYKKAVQFYFPGAEVKMQLTIDLVGAAEEERDQPGSAERLLTEEPAEERKVLPLDHLSEKPYCFYKQAEKEYRFRKRNRNL